jgi:hypothetical protein
MVATCRLGHRIDTGTGKAGAIVVAGARVRLSMNVITFGAKQQQQFLGFLNFGLDKLLRKQLARPSCVKRESSEKRRLPSKRFKWRYSPLPRQTDDDLLYPRRAQRLSKIGITDDFSKEIELVARDFVRELCRFDKRLNFRQKRSVCGRDVAPEASNRDLDIDPVRIFFSRMRMARVIKIMEQSCYEQDPHLARGQLVLIVPACLIA